MEKGLKQKIIIEVADEKEQMKVGTFIHEQLVGNKDYINNNIILNIETENIIEVLIFEECTDVPVISI